MLVRSNNPDDINDWKKNGYKLEVLINTKRARIDEMQRLSMEAILKRHSIIQKNNKLPPEAPIFDLVRKENTIEIPQILLQIIESLMAKNGLSRSIANKAIRSQI